MSAWQYVIFSQNTSHIRLGRVATILLVPPDEKMDVLQSWFWPFISCNVMLSRWSGFVSLIENPRINLGEIKGFLGYNFANNTLVLLLIYNSLIMLHAIEKLTSAEVTGKLHRSLLLAIDTIIIQVCKQDLKRTYFLGTLI